MELSKHESVGQTLLCPAFKQRIVLDLHCVLQADNVRQHLMATLFWECTLRRNLHCGHCSSGRRVESEVDELLIADSIHIIDGLTPHVDPNKLLVVFTGSEALVWQDIEEAGLALYRRGYPWGIVANGMLLDKKRLESLCRAGLHTATVNLDGFAEAHNALRGHPLGYERAWRAIQLLTQTGGSIWDVVTCVNPMNLGSFPAFHQQLIDASMKRWRLFSIFPVGRAAKNKQPQLFDSQYYQMIQFIIETNEAGEIKAQYGCEGYLEAFEGRTCRQFYQCRAGVNIASILCDGSISACPSIRLDHKQGNIHYDDLWQVREERFESYRDCLWAKTGPCADCKNWKYRLDNGMHLRDDEGKLLVCHLQRLGAGAETLRASGGR